MSIFVAWWVILYPFHDRQLSGNLAAHGLMSSLYSCPIAHGRPTALSQKDNNSQRIAGLCSKSWGPATRSTYIPMCMSVLVAQLYLTLCDPMDCSPPGSSVHEILQARILGCIATSFSRVYPYRPAKLSKQQSLSATARERKREREKKKMFVLSSLRIPYPFLLHLLLLLLLLRHSGLLINLPRNWLSHSYQ